MMFAAKNFSKAANVFKALSVTALCVLALVCSGECFDGAARGIQLCLSTLVPSLFPFTVLAALIMNSGLAQKIGRPLSGVTKFLFGLDGCFAPAIILSMLGGYPVGAGAISSLYESGAASEAQCKRAAMFCVCSGPGFAVSYIGSSLYSSEGAGLVLLGAQCLSVVILGIFMNIISKFKRKKPWFTRPCPAANAPPKINGQGKDGVFVSSVLTASKNMAAVCAFAVLFSAFTGVICKFITEPNLQSAALILTEVCSAVNKLSQNAVIEAAAFAAGFGGICVHFQIFAALGKLKINKLEFFFTRIIQGLLTAALMRAGLKIFSVSAGVFSTSAADSATIFGGSVLSGAVLIFTAICFIWAIKREH